MRKQPANEAWCRGWEAVAQNAFGQAARSGQARASTPPPSTSGLRSKAFPPKLSKGRGLEKGA